MTHDSKALRIGEAEFDALISCDQACSGDPYCYAEECGFEQAQCFFDDTGSDGCTDIFDCLDGCATGDDICVEACYENSTAQAQGQALSYIICVNESCPAGSPETCVGDAVASECATVYNACIAN